MAFLSSALTGPVIFEIGGAPVCEELARDGRVVLHRCRFLLIILQHFAGQVTSS